MFLFEEDAVLGLEISGGPFQGPELVPGDFDGNGSVDQNDADILQANMFTAGGVSSGDVNGDGNVNFQDLADFAPLFAAATGGAVGAQSVPEPSATVLGLLGVVSLLTLRRRTR